MEKHTNWSEFDQICEDIRQMNQHLEEFRKIMRLIDEINKQPVVDSLLLLYDNGSER